MIYRNEGSEIEAVQFKRTNYDELVKFANNKVSDLSIERHLNGKAYCLVNTLHGLYKVEEGVYIAKDVVGELYIYDAEMFEKIYS